MPRPGRALVTEILAALEGAREAAIGLQHEALAAAHGRVDALVRALVAEAAGDGRVDPDGLPDGLPGERPGLARARAAIEQHRGLLLSLHDAVEATLRRASHRPPVAYGQTAQMQGSGARPLLTTTA